MFDVDNMKSKGEKKMEEKKIEVKNISFIKLPSVTEPSKCVLYYFDENKTQLYILQKNYYNPKIESILHEKEKINKNCVSLFINNYIVQNENSYACFPVDAIYLYISLIYENNTNNSYMTVEDYLNIFLKNNEKDRKNVTQNTMMIFKKNVNNVKERLKLTCDEMVQNNTYYFKPNWDKIKNFYNLKCITLYNYIVEQKIIFSDYAYQIDKEVIERHKQDAEENEIFNKIKENNTKHIDKYKNYKTNLNKYFVSFNNNYYKVDHQNLKTFTWLIIKGFMCSTVENKLIPPDITEHLNKIEEDDLKKKQFVTSCAKTKKQGLPTPKNQRMIESFFKRKK